MEGAAGGGLVDGEEAGGGGQRGGEAEGGMAGEPAREGLAREGEGCGPRVDHGRLLEGADRVDEKVGYSSGKVFLCRC